MNQFVLSRFSKCGLRVANLAALAAMLLVGCATVHGSQGAKPKDAISLSGTVEKICAGCDTVDLVNGGAVVWDIVSVRLDSPRSLSGMEITVKVLLEGDGVAQRNIYPMSKHIKFFAAKAAIDSRRVLLHLDDIKATD